MAIPFRWDLSKREQIGSWTKDVSKRPKLDDWLLNVIRKTAADILATSEGADLAFIGRTPETFFDYLSGSFHALSEAPNLHLLQFSMRWPGKGGVKAIDPHTLEGLSEYFHHEGVHPEQIAKGSAPLAMVDFIAYGGTMKTLCEILHRMALEAGTDWNAVQRRLMIIGLLPEGKTSPKTWRWQQHQDWLTLIPDTIIRNVSVHAGFILDLANRQDKVTPSFTQNRWGETGFAHRHTPNEDQRRALSLALDLFERASTKNERHLLSQNISGHARMKHASVRKLVKILRNR